MKGKISRIADKGTFTEGGSVQIRADHRIGLINGKCYTLLCCTVSGLISGVDLDHMLSFRRCGVRCSGYSVGGAEV